MGPHEAGMAGTRQRRDMTGEMNTAAADAAGSPWLTAGPNGEGLDVFDFPTYIIGRISGLVRRSLIPHYVEPYGLTIPEWRLLAFFVLSEPASFNEICAALTMDRAQVSRTLPVLEKRGLIKRGVILRKGPRRRGESGRQIRFAATARGRNLYRQALPLAQRHQMVLLGALSRDERAAFYAALQKITQAAERFERERGAAVTSARRAGNRNGKATRRRRTSKKLTTNDRTPGANPPRAGEELSGGLT
jgi:DNA-binding MarR family transcriptional regulator